MSTEHQPQLKIPLIDLSDGFRFPLGCEDIILCKNNIYLCIQKNQVTIFRGFLINKVLSFDEEIIHACVATFKIKDEATDIMALCFRQHINFYYPHGKLYTLHLPFDIVLAREYEKGLILQTRTEIYLVNKNFDLKFVDKDTNSAFSNHEHICTYNQRDKGVSLCTTMTDGAINVYHVKNSSRSMKFKSKSLNKMQKKKHYAMSGNTSSISKQSEQKMSSFFIPEHRTSTLLSEARVSNQDSSPVSSLQKDVILSKIETIEKKLNKNHVRVFSISFEDQQGVVIVNKLRQELYVYKYSSYSKYQSVYKCPCLDTIPMHSNFEGCLAVLDDTDLSIVNPFLDLRASCNLTIPINTLISSYDGKIAFKSNDESIHIAKLILEPASQLVSSCLNCFRYLSGSTVIQKIWMLWRSAYNTCGDEWDALVIALLSLFFPFEDKVPCVENEITRKLPQARLLQGSSCFNYDLSDLIPYIVLSLHLLREEYRLDVLKKDYLTKLGSLLSQLTAWMGWAESWPNYYSSSLNIDKSTRFLSIQILQTPPNLLESLASLFTNTIVPFLSFSQLVEESDSIDAIVTPQTHNVLKIFEILVSSQYGPSNLVDMMNDLGVTSLDTFPLGVSFPLKEALSVAQENPNFEWSLGSLELIGREDLSKLLSSTSASASFASSFKNDFTEEVRKEKKQEEDIESLTTQIMASNEVITSWDDQSEARRLGITKLIFDYDRRYYEVTTLLHQTKTQTAYLKVDDNVSEYDLVLLQRSLAIVVALRTLTIPLGRAALFYDGRKPILTEKFPIPKFNLNTLISPTMTNIIHSEENISAELSAWGYFHNGASSGLSISKDSKGISGSWIIFNKPPDLNAQHAGFLLGLGLNGHLKNLEEWHIYNYLGPKHPLTSVGLLIGMAASLRGSMDNKLTKVLSVHAVALLPRGANDLNVPTMVQTAGLIGIGLLYSETQHRRMSEILLSQIAGTVQQNDIVQVHEGYRLASGIALGYVNLGKGDDLRGLNDTHVVDKLLSFAVSTKNSQPGQELSKSCCGAIMALCMIYLKTENANVANKLKVPDSEQLLDYVRPDLLFLRCFAVNMIMWSKIKSTRSWVESQMPKFVLDEFNKVGGFHRMDSDSLMYFNILGGSCLSMALKYASSYNIEARNTILYYLDKLMKLTSKSAVNYDQKLTYNTAITIQNVLALCAAVIMAASGDLEVFRRLRVLHNDTNRILGFGGYMAINTALGFLFLGGGQMAFDNDSLFGIASLITSLYPIYPKENSEYEVHLQALRHFWALAVVPRCLIIRDVKTKEACKIPILIKMKNGELMNKVSPCLIPNLKEISQIQTKSANHFDVIIDFELKSEILENFEKSLTIYVYKKQNYQLLKPSVRSMLQNKSKEQDNTPISSLLNNCEVFQELEKNSKLIWQNEFSTRLLSSTNLKSSGLSIYDIIENKLELMKYAKSASSIEDIWNLKLVFEFTNRMKRDYLHYIQLDFIHELKQILCNKYFAKDDQTRV
ncbi:APC1 [Candida oxycetoniae]|uniref:APC1 n=1 Tax=Candida oxycetoniae TaxID=497107 RepID=A0AAI9WVV0_9ASCO|nr:APC1 [Candida oxycetoniae]KAI3402435.2 APC1 [Candida oxycetoniae]